MMRTNDRQFLEGVTKELLHHGLDIWVFGRWAEELRGIRKPWDHADIDLLLRARDFSVLERTATSLPAVTEIHGKRFSHKRAFDWNGILVELIIVTPVLPYISHIFDGRVIFHWPSDTFEEGGVSGLHVASRRALELYRQEHDRIARAYKEYKRGGVDLPSK